MWGYKREGEKIENYFIEKEKEAKKSYNDITNSFNK